MEKICGACRVLIRNQLASSYVRAVIRSQHSGPSTFSLRTHSCGELRNSHVGKEVTLCGWIQHRRYDFMLTLRDSFGTTQVVLKEQIGKDVDNIRNLSAESVVMVTGKVQLRPDGLANKKMSTGDIEVVADQFEILNNSKESLPFEIHDFSKVKESTRMLYRYLDLRSTRMQHNMRQRSDVAMKMRHFLWKLHGFVEVETPTLFRRTPGGAREYLVPTRQPGKFYTLPQSPQQFKQLLMVGAIDRYFQIARCYRDEGSRSDRQPEFTQVDIEMSFINKEGIQALIEELLQYAWPDNLPSIHLPFPRMTYAQAMDQFGTDKPDTRFDMKLQDVTRELKDSGVAVFSSTEGNDAFVIKVFKCSKGMNYLKRKDYEDLQKEAVKLKDGGVTFIQIKDTDSWKSSISKHLRSEARENLGKAMKVNPGDVLCLAAGKPDSVNSLLGQMRLACANRLEANGASVRDHGSFHFLWVEDFPLFLPKEDGQDGELESSHHPFTAPVDEHKELIMTQPSQVHGQHYDLVLDGSEIAGGSIRIHDAKLQKHVLQNILNEDASSMQHLLEALESGCPPHGGIAIGFDRLIAILAGEPSIREVIAFPKTIDGNDLMSGAPSLLYNDELAVYHIRHDIRDATK
ncbi:aspartate--tRNA ligase, mitochondrial-like [Amphiura filiformis]|uniref:aspartate--tRNA ligase, mitochondrial-like n=1 Tax=Amphiura filiformis TaxID=82378 RepID=UPI003B2142D8